MIDVILPVLKIIFIQLWVVSAAKGQLPLQIEDAMRRAPTEEELANDKENKLATVNLDTRLDNRFGFKNIYIHYHAH